MRYFDRKFHHYSLYSEETSRRNVSFFSSATLLFFFLFSFFFSFFHYFLEIDFSFFDKIERVVLIPAIPNHLILHPVAHLTFRIIRPSFFSYIKWPKESPNWNWKDLIHGSALITIVSFLPSSRLLTKLTPWNGNLPHRIYRPSRMYFYLFKTFFLLFDQSYRLTEQLIRGIKFKWIREKLWTRVNSVCIESA